jgi:hypothetical protein
MATLWLVVSLILAMFFGWYAYLLLPTESRINRNYDPRVDQLTRYLKESSAQVNDYPGRGEYIASLKEDIRKKNVNLPLELAALPKERRETLTPAFDIWIGLSVGMYIAGWLLGWVYRGFRNKASGTDFRWSTAIVEA